MNKRLAVIAASSAALVMLPASEVYATSTAERAAVDPQTTSLQVTADEAVAGFEVTGSVQGKPVTFQCKAEPTHYVDAAYRRHVLLSAKVKYGYRANCTNGKVSVLAAKARLKHKGRYVAQARVDKCSGIRACNPGVHSRSVKVCKSGTRCAGRWQVAGTWALTLKPGYRLTKVPRGCKRGKNARSMTCRYTSRGLVVPPRH